MISKESNRKSLFLRVTAFVVALPISTSSFQKNYSYGERILSDRNGFRIIRFSDYNITDVYVMVRV